MEFKGTRGKWEKVVDDKKYILVRAGQIYKERPNFYSMKIIVGRICSDDCGIPTCCRTEEHANALLISKAPEMLQMLEMHIYALDNGVLDFYKKYGFNISELSGKVRELIKEATCLD